MAEKPSKPTGDFAFKEVAYAGDGTYKAMSTSEFSQGRNNTGEPETPLGSIPNAQKDNYLYRYITEQIIYLTKMVEYLDGKTESNT